LVLLSPDIVEAILDGRQPAQLTVKALLQAFPVAWKQQKSFLIANISAREYLGSSELRL
jgi:hypothetical protein